MAEKTPPKIKLKAARTNADFSAKEVAEIVGKNYSMPVADNATVEGRQQNRRVEVYMYASETMIKEAETESKN